MQHTVSRITAQHNSLDARLSTVFLHAAWGAMDSARREFEFFRTDLDAHLRESERELFTGLVALDDRERALERVEWKTHVRDLQRVTLAVERELTAPSDSVLYESFGVLRREIRRHCNHDERLLRLARDASTGAPVQEAVHS